MEDCPFCRIVEGKAPCYKVYEDENFLGFLDIRPLNPGNSLLIPKKHYHWVYNLPDFGRYWEVAKRLALAIKKVVAASSINFLTLGYEVPHAHIRIIPRFENDGHYDGIRLSAVKNIAKEEMKRITEKIYKELKNG